MRGSCYGVTRRGEYPCCECQKDRISICGTRNLNGASVVVLLYQKGDRKRVCAEQACKLSARTRRYTCRLSCQMVVEIVRYQRKFSLLSKSSLKLRLQIPWRSL